MLLMIPHNFSLQDVASEVKKKPCRHHCPITEAQVDIIYGNSNSNNNSNSHRKSKSNGSVSNRNRNGYSNSNSIIVIARVLTTAIVMIIATMKVLAIA